MRNVKTILLLAALLSGCAPTAVVSAGTQDAAVQAAPQERRDALFAERLRTDPDGIWASTVKPEILQAVSDFKTGKTLANGEAYGASVKTLDLRGKTPAQIGTLLQARGFKRHDEVVRKFALPVLDKDGKTIPQTIYVHPDGGTVRVKPRGDSTSKKRPQPHVVKSVRYPHDGDHRDFNTEGFKVDMDGRPLPKAPFDLKNPYQGTPLEETYQDGWGDAAHSDLSMLQMAEEAVQRVAAALGSFAFPR